MALWLSLVSRGEPSRQRVVSVTMVSHQGAALLDGLRHIQCRDGCVNLEGDHVSLIQILVN